MFDVCVVVIIHGHQSAYLFGDSSHKRIYLYQKIEATHYDALLPDPAYDICSEAEAEDDEAHGYYSVDSEEVQKLFLQAVFPETPPPSNADVTAACDWLKRELNKPVAEAFEFNHVVSAFKETMKASIIIESEFSGGVPLHPPLICLTNTSRFRAW